MTIPMDVSSSVLPASARLGSAARSREELLTVDLFQGWCRVRVRISCGKVQVDRIQWSRRKSGGCYPIMQIRLWERLLVRLCDHKSKGPLEFLSLSSVI